MIIREGLHAVKAIRARFPEITILADPKVVDGGRMVDLLGVPDSVARASEVEALGMEIEVVFQRHANLE
ncbi:MAG: hypothetical protein V3T35_00355 [Spirochaetia bacterium]|jgi:3-keto-L-gulonate-6-phosphate decarboxylase